MHIHLYIHIYVYIYVYQCIIHVYKVWKLLPWNGGPFDGRSPACKVTVVYVDDSMRVTKDRSGALYVYMRPL